MTERRFNPRNAGGTSGGVGSFLLGLGLMIVGFYLFLKSVHVNYGFAAWGPMYSIGGWHLTGGIILIPAIIGIAMVFSNGASFLGWLLLVGSLLALFAGIITSINFTLSGMPLFDLLVVLFLIAGGAGIFIRSLRSS
jgi:hypothetical protein